MKFKIEVKTIGRSARVIGRDSIWWETFDEPRVKTIAAAKAFGQNVINGFNHFLRPGEQKRHFTGNVEMLGPSEKHTWRKTNLVTIIKGSQAYDTMRCEVCGATGKRHGLGASGVTLDREYKKLIICPGKK